MSGKNLEAIYPLSPSQQGMLFETLAAGEAGVHIEQLGCRIQGRFDPQAFAAAWQQVVDRHPVLRTAFVWQDQPEPLQVVARRLTLPLIREDWRDLPADEQERRLEALLEAERRREFKLNRPPLLRLVLARLADTVYHFCWTFHHLLLDGWCVPQVLGEVLAFYQVHATGADPGLPPCRPYRDYIAWLRDQDEAQARDFWRDRLAGFSRPTPLGVPAPAGPVPASRYGELSSRLPASLGALLQDWARRRRLTLNSLMQGLWGVLLSRYSGLEEVVFGATVAGRPPDLDGVESMLGPFINTLPVRLRVPAQADLASWLEAVQARQFAQRPYEYCSAGQIHRWSGLSGALPLYESLLVFENYPAAGAAELPFTVQAVRASGARTQAALTLIIAPGEGLEFRLVYDRSRFADADARLVLEHLQRLAEAVTAAPELAALRERIPVDRIPRIKMPANRQQVYVAPRTAQEVQLVRLWEDLLELAPIGVRDNFFALGGHSLLVLRLMAAIEQRFGKKLPLGTLFQSPTVEKLAQTIQRRSDPADWSPLVAIQPSGSKIPLFCIHPLGGHVICYGDLARHLGQDQPVYGLQARGLEPGQTPLRDYAALAAYYREALGTVWPRGPYLLAGYSFGGLAAFEIARQLLAQGRQVALVALLDTPNPQVVPEPLKKTDSAGLLVSLFAESFPLSLEHLRQLSEDEQLAFVLERAKAADLVTLEAGMDEARRYFEVCKANHEMVFEPSPYPGRLTLLRGREEALRITADPALGWEALAGSGVEIHWVPGRHENMLNPEHTEGVARVLRACCERAVNT